MILLRSLLFGFGLSGLVAAMVLLLSRILPQGFYPDELLQLYLRSGGWLSELLHQLVLALPQKAPGTAGLGPFAMAFVLDMAGTLLTVALAGTVACYLWLRRRRTQALPHA